MACLLNRYSFKFSAPARSGIVFGGTKVKCSPFLVQIEQLHAVTMARSEVQSKRTMPQWQPPVNVRKSGMLRSPTAGNDKGRGEPSGSWPILAGLRWLTNI